MDHRRLRGVPTVVAVLAAALALFAAAAGAPARAADGQPRVFVATLDGDVNPVTQDYLQDVMRQAVDEGAAAVTIEMDTPGGLGSAMREIVQTMLALEIPVIVYVTPQGASADSAGAVIGMAADVLAMSPQTNIGSSTPIQATGEDFQEDLRKKVVNDAAAYVGELAREHGRNAEAAEAMVRDAANYGATEALEIGLVDDVADSLPALLDEIDGRVVQPKGLTLQTAYAELVPVEMSFWKQALDLLIDPNIITLMLSLGIVGLLVELWNPGLIFPGTVGAISLLVGLYGLQVLPVSVAGALLLLLAVAFWIAEAFVPSHGALTVAGGVMFVIGALMLFDPAGDAYQVSVWTALAISGALMLLLGVALTRIVKARRNPVAVGVSTLVGEEAVVREADWVTLAGERWRARSVDGSRLQPGEHVTIEAVDTELGLLVRPRTPTERPTP